MFCMFSASVGCTRSGDSGGWVWSEETKAGLLLTWAGTSDWNAAEEAWRVWTKNLKDFNEVMITKKPVQKTRCAFSKAKI